LFQKPLHPFPRGLFVTVKFLLQRATQLFPCTCAVTSLVQKPRSGIQRVDLPILPVVNNALHTDIQLGGNASTISRLRFRLVPRDATSYLQEVVAENGRKRYS